MSDYYKDSNVLVTGGTGTIGRPLVQMLVDRGAKVTVASLDDPQGLPEGVVFLDFNLDDPYLCRTASRPQDYVFHLAGSKGGVGIGRSRAADFMAANTRVNVSMIEAAAMVKVKRFLFTSSIGVYPGDKEIFIENEAWDGPPHESDFFGGWSKRFGELLCESFRVQSGLDYVIVRPTNSFGPWDNFNPETAMVVGALIGRACGGENPLKIWGDGQQERDLLYSGDCARGMMLAMEHGKSGEAYNLASGVTISISELAGIIASCMPQQVQLAYDLNGPVGNLVRLMNIDKAKQDLGFEPKVSILDAIAKTIDWYRDNPEYKKWSAFK